jgi:hypothetical protein
MDGKVFSFTSAAGYNFNKHFGVDVGIPVYVVRAPAPVQGSRSSNGYYVTTDNTYLPSKL